MIDSRIYALCFSNETHLPTLHNYVADQVQIIIDACGFLNGLWFDVDIQTAAASDGSFTSFNTKYDALANTTSDRPIEYLEMLPLLTNNSALVLALSDLRSAMRAAADTGLFCYRALESIMQSFRQPHENEKQAWQRMNSALRSTYGYIKNQIKQFSDARRHGADFFITGAQRDACIIACATIVYRYCRYLQFGKVPLGTEYVLLTDENQS